ncbi:hypothetical protein, partial [Lactobacillus delbrueckii]|uniref:hypothetical protein n=1 Tax=Lactobacillus delbrueckii TaxID=1584 RepID=UPI001CD83B85
ARIKSQMEVWLFLFYLGVAKRMCAFYSTSGPILIISLKIDSTMAVILIIGNFFTQLPTAF